MNNEQTITAVSEAFSMQPAFYKVGYKYQTQQTLTRIVIESIYDTGDPYDFYVGYDSNGNKVFAMRVQCANVQYN